MFKATTTRSALAILLALSIFTIGCTTNDLQVDLSLTANLSQSAALTISGIQMNPADRQLLVSSLNALSQAATQGSTYLAAGPLTAQEITNLLAGLSTAIIKNWPANIPPVVLAAVQAAQAVAQIVIGLLQSMQSQTLGSNNVKAKAPSTSDLTGLKLALQKYQVAVKALQAAK